MNDEHAHADQDDTEATGAARDWVVRLASSDVSAGEMRRFKAWLARSPAHREAFEKERAFWQRLGGLKSAAGPETLGEAQPIPRLSASRPAPLARPRRLLAGGLAAACVALAVVFGGEVGVALKADHRTAVAEQKIVRLPDGSAAHLNTDSAIAVAYGEAERRIQLLRGEVLFEVVPDSDKPFRVEAAEGITKAVGTAFVVHRAGDGATVTVTEGTVSVTSPTGATEPAATVLAARGFRTRYREGQAPQLARAVDTEAIAPWRKGIIRIDDMPLNAAIVELGRYRPGRVVLLDNGTAYQSVSGTFSIDEVDAAIAGLAATHGLKVTQITEYLLILR